MAESGRQAELRMRCVQCDEVDVPMALPGGPGWIAIALWVAALATWAVTLWTVAFAPVFWTLLAAAMLYTMWYFFKREQACRRCGGRHLEPSRSDAEPV